MTNSIRTPRQGVTANSKRIAEAVDDELWQTFRLALKGLATDMKLSLLSSYYDEGQHHYNLKGNTCDYEDCEIVVDDHEWENYQIRIDNYIKALCRGGQLYAGESLETALAADWKLRIKK